MKSSIFLILVFLSFSSFSQEERKSKIRYVSVEYGIMNYHSGFNWTDLVRIKDKSSILQNLTLDSIQTSFYNDYRPTSKWTTNFQLAAGFNLPRKAESTCFTNPRLILGFQFYTLMNQLAYGNSETSNYDTLTSSLTGNQTIITKSNSRYLTYLSNQHIVQFNVAYQTDILAEKKQFNPYIGVSFGTGIAYLDESSVTYSQHESINEYYSTSVPFDSKTTFEEEKIGAKNSVVISTEIKTGISYRANKLPAYTFFLEYRPGFIALFSGAERRNVFKNNFQLGIQIDFWNIKKA